MITIHDQHTIDIYWHQSTDFGQSDENEENVVLVIENYI